MHLAALTLLSVPFTGWLATTILRRYCPSAGRTVLFFLMAATCTIALWSLWHLPPEEVLIGYGLGWVLLLLASIDGHVYRLPDAFTLPLIVFGLVMSFLAPEPSFPDRVIGAVLGYGVFALLRYGFRLLRGHDGLGLGDAKLAAAAGAWLGWLTLPLYILIASASALVWVGVRLPWRKPTEPLAFGISLAVTLWLMWLYRTTIVVLP